MRYFALIALIVIAAAPMVGCSCGANPNDTALAIRNPFRVVETPTIAPTGYGVVQAVPQQQYRLVPIPAASPVAPAASASACQCPVEYTPGFTYASPPAAPQRAGAACP